MNNPTTGERAVLLGDWPMPAAGAPEPRIFADDSVLSLIYKTAEGRVAVVHFPHCTYFAFGAPNDEAMGGHPLSGRGLQYYSVHEVLDSSLIQEMERRNSVHHRHDPDLYITGKKHYIFTFQDNTLECVFGSRWWAPTVAMFDREDEAIQSWRAAANLDTFGSGTESP